MAVSRIKEFLKLESAGGIILVCAAILGLAFENTPLKVVYDSLLELPLEISFGQIYIAKPLILWINDGLMAIFFLLVGLEVKREFLSGELSTWKQISLPAFAAVGGMAVPALLYTLVNLGPNGELDGWAIPAATDIAFALGVLALLGSKAPTSLKILLTTIAIFDDLGAIIIIAIFYTAELSLFSLTVAGLFTLILIAMNRIGVRSAVPYILVGTCLWVAVLKSGVHATLAGVIVALCIPFIESEEHDNPLIHLEHELHPWVAYLVLPVFAFSNSGISFEVFSVEALSTPVALGTMLGLVVGKTVGVTSFMWVAHQLGVAELPKGSNWTVLTGLAALTGIGFTMSIFISGLACEEEYVLMTAKAGIFIGSITAAAIGSILILAGGKAVEEVNEEG